MIGRGERIRTSDPLLPKQVLYQAEPLPEHGLQERIVGARPGASFPFDYASTSVAESTPFRGGEAEAGGRD